MIIKDIVGYLKSLAHEPYDESKTVDLIKVGDENEQVKKIVVAMFATPDIIRQAHEYGANFIIVHEPLFYTHRDREMPFEQCAQKKRLLEDLGMTVFRFHDYAHSTLPDLIYEGQIAFSGFCGRFERGKYFAVNRFILDREMTTLELVRVLEKNLGVKHLRIVGCRDNTVKTVSCCFGTPPHVLDEVDECDTVLTGEICEWSMGEYVRDAVQLGKQKSMVVMGHINSEKFGMVLLADMLSKKYPQLDVKYLNCGDIYTYTD